MRSGLENGAAAAKKTGAVRAEYLEATSSGKEHRQKTIIENVGAQAVYGPTRNLKFQDGSSSSPYWIPLSSESKQ